MFNRIKNRIKFQIERLLLFGVFTRLLVIGAFVGLVAIGGGVLVQTTDTPFDNYWTAIWWAFLRLTDPGYLGDDEGVARRTISTVVTVLGYVLFMGSLIAILTQWLNQTIRNLERGLTPIVRRNHILILGWTNRTSAIIEELVQSEGQVRRFLRRRGARNLHVVILAEDVSLERTMELREDLGVLWDPKKITFRSGTPLRIEHLERVDFHHASAIILPGADFVYGSADESDTRIVKTLLSVAQTQKDRDTTLPQLVTEIFDPDKIPMVRGIYQGIMEILSSDTFIARCLVQNIRHPGLSHVFRELLSHGAGAEIYVRGFEAFAGMQFGDLKKAFPAAILLGLVRPAGRRFCPMLNPTSDLVLESEDRLVFLSGSYEDCEPVKGFQPESSDEQIQELPNAGVKPQSRVLILGWNHKAVDVLKECDRYVNEQFEIEVLSLTPVSEREQDIKKEISERKSDIVHHDGDYTSLTDLEKIQPGGFDNIVLLGTDRLETQEESDARTIVGHMVLMHILEDQKLRPDILVELMDDQNLSLFEQYRTEVLVTPIMASHVLAQVALRRELNVVYEELFGPEGTEIVFRSLVDYDIIGQHLDFETLKLIANRYDELALGIRLADGHIELNPARDKIWTLTDKDCLIVLSRGHALLTQDGETSVLN